MYQHVSELSNYPYEEWESSDVTYATECFDDLTDDEMIALPADIQMDAYRRTAQGGLIVEGGDQTASVELVKRINTTASGTIDIRCQVDDSVIYELDYLDNPYCNTEFAFDYVPPRINEPRLPASNKTPLTPTGLLHTALAGIGRCLAAAIDVVQTQRRFGGDATKLATYYARLWNVDIEFFMRPYLGPPMDASEIDLIASYDEQEYLTYIDPAWQAIVSSSRPALTVDSFGPRAIIHWDRVFYLCRLQFLKGLLATGVTMREMNKASLIFRIDAAIVHHYEPRCHAISLPDELTPSRDLDVSLLDYIKESIMPLVYTAIEQSVLIELGGPAVGNLGTLQLVAPTAPRPRRTDPTQHDIRTASHKVMEFFSRDSFPLIQGLSFSSVVERVLESGLDLHEVHLVIITMCYYFVRLILQVPDCRGKLLQVPDVSHRFAHELGIYASQWYGDARVMGFLTSVRQDVVRDRGKQYDAAYYGTFGKAWCLPPSYGQYARFVQQLAFMVAEESLGRNTTYKAVGAVKRLHEDWRGRLHNGVYLGTLRNIAQTSRNRTPYHAHENMMAGLRDIYGRLLEVEEHVSRWVFNISLKYRPLTELRWISIVLTAKRGLLSCIKYNHKLGQVYIADDEVRRVLITLLKAMLRDVPPLKGSVEQIWEYALRHLPTQIWVPRDVRAYKPVTIRHVSELRKWFYSMVELQVADHKQLTELLNTPLPIPDEDPPLRPSPRLQTTPPEEDLLATILGGAEPMRAIPKGAVAMYADIQNLIDNEDDEDFWMSLRVSDYDTELWVRLHKEAMQTRSPYAAIEHFKALLDGPGDVR